MDFVMAFNAAFVLVVAIKMQPVASIHKKKMVLIVSL